MDRFKQHMEYKAHEENVKDIVKELGVLRTEIERLRKALEFYFPGEKWEDREEEHGTVYPIILDDGGKTAKQALKEGE